MQKNTRTNHILAISTKNRHNAQIGYRHAKSRISRFNTTSINLCKTSERTASIAFERFLKLGKIRAVFNTVNG